MPTRNDGPVSSADAGSSCIDRQTFRAWLTPRIGRSAANGQFEVLLESREPIAPDPNLVQPRRALRAARCRSAANT
ncbi:transporter substrate-binding protein [Bradyrhizobium niftali]|uniref:transporter substrate-binding protein n=1 Tax=Bradyrhizobium niftali TaxID=2560055 RepID=UPI003850177D